MRKIILYIATSIDNFIATSDGGVEWLHSPEFIVEGEDYGYGDFYSSIDTTIMGNKTYKQIIGFGSDFPYPDKKNHVITSEVDLPHTSYVKFISGNIEDFCKRLKNEAGKDIWLVGGGRLNTFLLDHELIDEIIMTRIPLALGDGIPLFYDENWNDKFEIVTTRSFRRGVTQSTLKFLKR